MVLKPEVVERRFEELDWTLQRLDRHRAVDLETYESDPPYQGSLDGLHEEGVISSELHEQLQGLGGFRNLLVHEYLELDPAEVLGHLRRAFRVFPRFAREILAWMESRQPEAESR